MKYIFITISLFYYISSIAQDTLTPVDINGRLQVIGNQITGSSHQSPVQLRGLSLFWSQWSEGSKYYNENVVNTLVSDWKINIVRAAMGVGTDVNGYLSNPTLEKNKVKAIVDAAIANGIYVIIDWHSHEAHLETDEAKIFFAEMAQLYGHHPNIIYEVYNEPLNSPWASVIKPYCDAVIDTIRVHDPDNLVICGTRRWSQEVEEVATTPVIDTNVAYTLHYYASSHGQGLRNKAQAALNKGLPLFVTEFGITEASGDGRIDYEESKLWWQFLEDNHISWCNWSLSDKAEAASVLKPFTPNNGNWSIANYTESGLFIRDKLRSTHQLPSYKNSLKIVSQTNVSLLPTDTTFQFSFQVYDDSLLIPDSLITFKYEVSNGGSISDSGLFIPNGETGTYRLFVTAIVDSIATTVNIDFITSDAKIGAYQNDTTKTILALSSNTNYLLSTDITTSISQLIPQLGDSIIIGDTTYYWKQISTPNSTLSQSDTAVNSYFAIYLNNPVSRLAQLNITQSGSSTIYINGNVVGNNNFELIKGDNIMLVEYKGSIDTSYFDFVFLTPQGDSLPNLSYSLTTSSTYDCNNDWAGTAYIDTACGCLGGNTGKLQCPGPYNGTPSLIPGIIQMEAYDWGGKGVAYNDETPGNTGSTTLRNPDDVDLSPSGDIDGTPNVGWIDQGEWLKYTVDIAESGKFFIDFRIASALTFGALDLTINNKSILGGQINVPNTGGWTTWQSLRSDTINLTAGEYELIFEAKGGAFNINYMQFYNADAVGIDNEYSLNTVMYPNPFNDQLTIEVKQPSNYQISTIRGIPVKSGVCESNCFVGAQLAKGTYLIEIQNKNKKTVQRIIKR